MKVVAVQLRIHILSMGKLHNECVDQDRSGLFDHYIRRSFEAVAPSCCHSDNLSVFCSIRNTIGIGFSSLVLLLRILLFPVLHVLKVTFIILSESHHLHLLHAEQEEFLSVGD